MCFFLAVSSFNRPLWPRINYISKPLSLAGLNAPLRLRLRPMTCLHQHPAGYLAAKAVDFSLCLHLRSVPAPPANPPTPEANSLSHRLGFQLTKRWLLDSVAVTDKHREKAFLRKEKNQTPILFFFFRIKERENVIISFSLPSCFSLKSRAPLLLFVRLTDRILSWKNTTSNTKWHQEKHNHVLFNMKLLWATFLHTKTSVLFKFPALGVHIMAITTHPQWLPTRIGQVWLPPGYSVCWKSMRQGARGEAGWLTNSTLAIAAN